MIYWIDNNNKLNQLDVPCVISIYHGDIKLEHVKNVLLFNTLRFEKPKISNKQMTMDISASNGEISNLLYDESANVIMTHMITEDVIQDSMDSTWYGVMPIAMHAFMMDNPNTSGVYAYLLKEEIPGITHKNGKSGVLLSDHRIINDRKIENMLIERGMPHIIDKLLCKAEHMVFNHSFKLEYIHSSSASERTSFGLLNSTNYCKQDLSVLRNYPKILHPYDSMVREDAMVPTHDIITSIDSYLASKDDSNVSIAASMITGLKLRDFNDRTAICTVLKKHYNATTRYGEMHIERVDGKPTSDTERIMISSAFNYASNQYNRYYRT